LGSGFVPWPHVTFGAVTAFPAVGGGVGTAVLPDADVLSDLRVLTVVATSMDCSAVAWLSVTTAGVAWLVVLSLARDARLTAVVLA